MNQLIDIFNSFSMTGKILIAVLFVLLIILLVLSIILLLKKNNNCVSNEADLDFFDELKRETDNTKSVFVKEEISSIPNEVKEEKIDLQSISQKIEKDIEKSNIDLTEFEVEQEEKAIISYNELINKVKQNELTDVNVQTVDLDDGGYNLEPEFTYDTEILDFSDLTEPKEETKFKPSEFISPVNGIQSPSQDLLNKTDIKSILDLDDISEVVYSNTEFLSALKDLRDSLNDI